MGPGAGRGRRDGAGLSSRTCKVSRGLQAAATGGTERPTSPYNKPTQQAHTPSPYTKPRQPGQWRLRTQELAGGLGGACGGACGGRRRRGLAGDVEEQARVCVCSRGRADPGLAAIHVLADGRHPSLSDQGSVSVFELAVGSNLWSVAFRAQNFRAVFRVYTFINQESG
jgi:hypothetical protein